MPLSVVAREPRGSLTVRNPKSWSQMNPNDLALSPVPTMYAPTTSRLSLTPKAMVEDVRGTLSR